jgi:hypothetical protein
MSDLGVDLQLQFLLYRYIEKCHYAYLKLFPNFNGRRCGNAVDVAWS